MKRVDSSFSQKSKLFEPFVNQDYLAKVFKDLNLCYYKEEYFGYLDVIQSFLNQNQSGKPQKERDKRQGEQNLLRNGPERHSINDIAQEVKQRYGSIDTGNVCDLCKKTKFSNGGVGHVCFNCKARCCVRCAFRYTTKAKVNLIFF